MRVACCVYILSWWKALNFNPDLAFVSKAWENLEVSKEKKYLLKYFDTPVQEAFLKYYLVFGNYTHFCDHTGYFCQVRWLKLLYDKFIKLEALKSKAKQEMDFHLLTRLEDGKFMMTKQK